MTRTKKYIIQVVKVDVLYSIKSIVLVLYSLIPAMFGYLHVMQFFKNVTVIVLLLQCQCGSRTV
jgi:hypothetical protein